MQIGITWLEIKDAFFCTLIQNGGGKTCFLSVSFEYLNSVYLKGGLAQGFFSP